MKSMRNGLESIFAATLIAGVLVFGQIGIIGTAQAGPAAELIKCSIIGDDERRLACYDIWTNDLKASGLSAEQALAPVIQVPVQVAHGADAPAPAGVNSSQETHSDPTSTDNFGLSPSRLPTPKQEKVTSLSNVVAEVSYNYFDKAVVTLENGQVWEQVDGARLRVKPGQSIFIRRGMAGGYFLQVDGKGRTIKVTRKK